MNIRTNVICVWLFMILLVLPFCKKSEEVQDLLIGKWKVDSVQARVFLNNTVAYQTISRPTTDYYDFRTADTVHVDWMSRHFVAHYKVVPFQGRYLIQFKDAADTILSINRQSLVFKSPQGSDSKLFLTKQ